VDGVELKMDLYFPPQTANPAPVAVFVHGGGWSQGDKTQGGLIPFTDLASQGFLVATVNYRLAPRYKFPAMIEDVKCAVRYLRANAVRLNVDPNRIGAWGGSAGGHLVALLGTTDASAGFDVGEYAEQSSRVHAVVDMFGPTDLNAMFPNASARVIQNIFAIRSSPEETAKLASPVTYVTKDDPPFLILQGDKDKTVPAEQSQMLYDRLKSTGVPATLVMVKNAGHGFAPTGGAISPTREKLIKMIVEFFVTQLK
jgi:acetyl esterase/lipase